MCRKCNFWIEQNDALIKTNAALGERNRALERIYGELNFGDLAEVLGKLNSTQLKAVKGFAEYLFKMENK